jgi:ATPase family associated with various cellular activities (AAA)
MQKDAFDISVISAAIATIIAAELVKKVGLEQDKYGPIYTLIIALVTFIHSMIPKSLEIPWWAQILCWTLVCVSSLYWFYQTYFGKVYNLVGDFFGKRHIKTVGDIQESFMFNFKPAREEWSEFFQFIEEQKERGLASYCVNGNGFSWITNANRTAKTWEVSDIKFSDEDEDALEYSISDAGFLLRQEGDLEKTVESVYHRTSHIDIWSMFGPGVFPIFFSAYNIKDTSSRAQEQNYIWFLGKDKSDDCWRLTTVSAWSWERLMSLNDPILCSTLLLCTKYTLDTLYASTQLSIIAHKLGYQVEEKVGSYLLKLGPKENPLFVFELLGKPRDNFEEALFRPSIMYYDSITHTDQMTILNPNYKTITLVASKDYHKNLVTTGVSPIYQIVHGTPKETYYPVNIRVCGKDLTKSVAESHFFEFCKYLNERVEKKYPRVSASKEVKRYELSIKEKKMQIDLEISEEEGGKGGGGGKSGGGDKKPPPRVSENQSAVEIDARECGLTCKNFSNMFLVESVEARLAAVINNFKNVDSLKRLGIPRKLGILLYGEPGCGKSSCIETICSELGKMMFSIKLSSIKTNTEFREICHYVIKNDGVLVIEDIDVDSDVVLRRELKREDRKKRESQQQEYMFYPQSEFIQTSPVVHPYSRWSSPYKYKSPCNSDKLNLSTILNVLQGSETRDGFVFIITTNCYEKLDSALVRSGRIDVTIKLERCTRYQISKIYKRVSEKDISPEVLEQIREYRYFPYDVIMGFYQQKLKGEIDVLTCLKEIDLEYEIKRRGRTAHEGVALQEGEETQQLTDISSEDTEITE